MNLPRLLVDAGNTRIKWRHEAPGAVETGGLDHDADLSAWAGRFAPGTRAWLASVAGGARTQILAAALQAAGLAVVPVAVRAASPVDIGAYAGALGVDRWLALVAAWRAAPEPALVVSAGTALTVDALDGAGRFLGGLILPGRRAMRQALTLCAAALAAVPEGRVHCFPTSTADALESGVARALAGAVRHQFEALAAKQGEAPRLLLTGGDADWLGAQLALARTESAPGLVLDGLAWYAETEEERCGS